MNQTVVVLFSAAFLLGSRAGETATNVVSPGRLLMVETSATTVSAAKARLTIGPLAPAGDIYHGDYEMRVSPFFFKSEKGRLAITIPRESIANSTAGRSVEITGTATTTGKNEKARRIDAIATPRNKEEGDLKLWFMVGERKLVFDTRYHFLQEKEVPKK